MKRFSLNGSDWTLTGWYVNQWRMLRSMELGDVEKPAVLPVTAQVPGAVQSDLLRAGLLRDPNYGLDSQLGEWVNNREWMYDKVFSLPAAQRGAEQLLLKFGGLDHRGEIFLNGEKLTDFEGMFVPLEIDITGKIDRYEKNHLRVVFLQSPEVDGQFGYSNQISVFKSRFNYAWDWCPRIVPVGIWEDVAIEASGCARIVDVFPKPDSTGNIAISTELSCAVSGEYALNYKIAHQGEVVAEKRALIALSASLHTIAQDVSVKNLRLWHPAGLGEQPLYQVTVEVYRNGDLSDVQTKQIGLRSYGWEMNKNSPAGAMPYTLTVNGRRVFMKGVNWVPILPFYGSVTREMYRVQLTRLKEMNANILRIWGGAILEKQDLYDLCDEMGILVWQEFPQSSSGINNTPPDAKETLKALEGVAKAFLRARRHHASLAVWCGGNELMWEGYVPVTKAHINIAMLDALVKKHDPTRRFLPTSASGPTFCASEENFGKGLHHDVHGPWHYEGAQAHYRFFNGDDALLRSETGCPGGARAESVRGYRGACDAWPPDATNAYWLHRGAWWIQWEQLTRLFGPWDAKRDELEEYLACSRYLQAEALRYAAESTARRAPASSGFLVWMGNEPYPNAANTSLLEYMGAPKPAYCTVRNAFAAANVSLRYDKIAHEPGEKMTCTPYLVLDSGRAGDFAIKWTLFDAAGKEYLSREVERSSREGVYALDAIAWDVQPVDAFFIRLEMHEKGQRLIENTYAFTTDGSCAFAPLRRLPKANIVARTVHGEVFVTNESQTVLANAFIEFADAQPPALITLLPGERRAVAAMPVRIEGVNAGQLSVA